VRGARALAVSLATGALWAAVPGGVAQAHPLGNFTVNHYDHVQLFPDRVELTAVVDRAEVPTAQALQTIAPDGSPTADQLAGAAAAECAEVAEAVLVTVDGARLQWQLTAPSMEVVPGAADLPTLRLSCELSGDADLSAPAQVVVEDTYLGDRVGWREMTADGEGVRLVDSPVPVDSVTDRLRAYPDDLLASPLDVRSFSVATEPGRSTGTGAAVTPKSGDPFSTAMAALDRRLEDLIGDRELTPLVGVLAVLLAVLLGCGHALLPGHGKTVMAAYLAARRGRRRDAVTVGATVTATHTVGVLVLGLAVSLSSSLAGDQVIRWLGVVSGLVVAGIGTLMLRGALPRWRAARAGTVPAVDVLPEPALAAAASRPGQVHAHPHDAHDHHAHGHDHDGDHGHGHGHGHDHDGDRGHGHGHDHDGDRGHGHGHDHDGDRGHGHGHDHDGDRGHGHGHGHDHDGDHGHGHGQDHDGDHGHGHGHDHGSWWAGGHSHGPGTGRGGLIGMGIAGGLVPSPSALIVLLASVGLGRTAFGVVLVLAYGLGMAATLTAVGLLLVRLRGRLARRVTDLGRTPLLSAAVLAAPVLTAGLVLAVGLGLAARGILLGA
jgi:nickel/cobalt exporter